MSLQEILGKNVSEILVEIKKKSSTVDQTVKDLLDDLVKKDKELLSTFNNIIQQNSIPELNNELEDLQKELFHLQARLIFQECDRLLDDNVQPEQVVKLAKAF